MGAEPVGKFPIVFILAVTTSAIYCIALVGMALVEIWNDPRWLQIPLLLILLCLFLLPTMFMPWFVSMARYLTSAVAFLVLNAVLAVCGVWNILEWLAASPNIPTGFAGNYYPYIYWASLLFSLIVWRRLHRREEEELVELMASRRREQDGSDD